MPEAAVHENHLFSRAEDEIGTTREIVCVGLRAKTHAPDKTTYRELRFGTARMHGAHDFRTLLRQDVIHVGQHPPCTGTA